MRAFSPTVSTEVETKTMTQTFADLGLSPVVLDAIAKKGFEEPTEIQAKTIPLLLESTQDVIAQAQTGTGKTATFGLVFTDRLTPGKSKSPQAIVLAPTRELAVQVAEEINSLKGDKPLKVVPIYGGQSWSMQHKHLRAGVDIVVGTPGRVMEHLDKGTLKLDEVEYFVLDEADEMLNMGFVEDIEVILEHVNPNRQVLLFSATMPSRIANLAKKYMNNPVSIKTQKDRIANNSVDQIYFEVFQRDKFEALCRIIDMEDSFYGIIFCRTKVECDIVSKQLGDRGYSAAAMHGDVTQDQRERILRSFKKGDTEVLVATDVAARGIDVNDLTHVINYSLPQNSESYVHRIGRTGRAGKDGKAITLITPAEFRKLRSFEYAAKAEITKQSIPDSSTMVELKKKQLMGAMKTIMEDQENLAKFENMAGEMFEDANPLTVVAALLKHSFASQLDKDTYRVIEETKKGRNSAAGSRPNGRSGEPAAFGTTRLFLTIGRKDGANPGKILQIVDNEFGVAGHHVGRIDIMDSYSFISVPMDEAEVILDAFANIKKQGGFATVRVERASEDKNADRYPGNKGKGSRPRGGGKSNRSGKGNGEKSNFFKKKRRS